MEQNYGDWNYFMKVTNIIEKNVLQTLIFYGLWNVYIKLLNKNYFSVCAKKINKQKITYFYNNILYNILNKIKNNIYN